MSTLNVGTIKSLGSSAPVFQNSSGVEKGQLAKVWANFNQQGTQALRDSFGVSSISDQGTGKTRINFSISFSNANYAIVGAIGQDGTNGDHGNNILIRDGFSESTQVFASSVDIVCHRGNSSVELMDKKTVCLAIFGD